MSNSPTPSPSDPVAEVRLIKEQVDNTSKLIDAKVDAHDKRILDRDKQSQQLLSDIKDVKDHVDSRSKIFGTSFALGLLGVLVVLLVALYASMLPIVQGVAQVAANQVEWDEEIEKAVDAELGDRLSAEVLAKVIKEEQIQEAARKVIDTEAFRNTLRLQVENAVNLSVGTIVNEMIAKENTFQAMIEKQLQAKMARLQEATNNRVTVTAKDRPELESKLIAAISQADDLGLRNFRVDLFPFNNDALRVSAAITWETQYLPKTPVRIDSLSFEDMTASELKPKIEGALGTSAPRLTISAAVVSQRRDSILARQL